jgi:hypothetical protein
VRPLNELQIDDAWQREVFDRLLAPVLREASYQGQIIFLDIASSVASLLQRRAHVDAVAQLPKGGTMSLEFKIVRWPHDEQGRPRRFHWRDIFLETWSCTVPGHQAHGWFFTSKADILLWSQCSYDERSLWCFAFPLQRLRAWYRRRLREQPELKLCFVENRIDGRSLWTRGRLAPISQLCRALRTEAFHVDENGLISDLWGKPLLPFMHSPA